MKEKIKQLNKNQKNIVLAIIIGLILIVFLFSMIEREPEELVELDFDINEFSQQTGSSPVSDGLVVTSEGEQVRYDVSPGTPEAPQQSVAVSENEIPDNAIKIKASRAGGYQPAEFTVKSGSVVVLSLTTEGISSTLKFAEPSLSAISIAAGNDETRVLTFNAPAPGEYNFYCAMPFSKLNGKMIVTR